MYEDSFTSGILSNGTTNLPRDYYRITLAANGLSPVIINTYLDNNLKYDIELKDEIILVSEEFSELTNWEILSGTWEVSAGTLISQTELFYDNNIEQKIISNTIPVEEGGHYVIKVDLRYELEWEKDFFSITYVSEDDTDTLLSLTGDKYEFYTEYIPLVISPGQANGHILLSLQTDYNLNYRGVEIEDIKMIPQIKRYTLFILLPI